MSHYPKQFPTEEAQHLYQMASTGTLRDNVAHAVHDSWWVGGFLAKFAIGEPDDHPEPGSENVDPAEALKAACTPEEYQDLQNLSLLAGITADELAQPGADPQGILDNIDIAKLFTNIQKVIQLLTLLKVI